MKKISTTIGILCLLLLAACNQEETEDTNQQISNINSEEEHQPVNAIKESDVLVDLKNAEGDKVAQASLVETDSGVNIALKGNNLPPGVHGFHIHENGLCEAPDFKSAGGHFNPFGKKHGFDHPEGRHAGDLENIEVANNGDIYTEVRADLVTLEKNKRNSLLKEGGTALVIHSEADDYKSQPSGNAGSRIACGVIK
ncbi:superoxide dismutase family protein [Oceanobacillus senegalensis]|uniref:superoxide dismutase family protein n=1 Tax=Oceanobacillus senegalensis TaxID=1936063 RepID=UPI000A312254|nr:superoxide dismutase family protein [Oceanobacillus senegalensis]